MAVHEAGHAVVAFSFYGPDSITSIAVHRDGSGCVNYGAYGITKDLKAAFDMAGVVSEIVFLGKFNVLASTNDRRSIWSLSKLHGWASLDKMAEGIQPNLDLYFDKKWPAISAPAAKIAWAIIDTNFYSTLELSEALLPRKRNNSRQMRGSVADSILRDVERWRV